MFLPRNICRLVAVTLAAVCTSAAAGDMFSPLNPFRAASNLHRGFSPFVATFNTTPDLPHVADANARLSLTGITTGYQVTQEDELNLIVHTYNGASTADNAGVNVSVASVDYDIFKPDGTNDGKNSYTGLLTGDVLSWDSGHVWWHFSISAATSIDDTAQPFGATFDSDTEAARNDIAGPANWTP